MIWATVPAGRAVARSGGAGRPAPKQFGPVGWIVSLIILAAIASLNWRVTVIVLGVMLALTLLLGLAGHAQQATRRPDPLDAAMTDLLGKDGRK